MKLFSLLFTLLFIVGCNTPVNKSEYYLKKINEKFKLSDSSTFYLSDLVISENMLDATQDNTDVIYIINDLTEDANEEILEEDFSILIGKTSFLNNYSYNIYVIDKSEYNFFKEQAESGEKITKIKADFYTINDTVFVIDKILN